MFNPGDGVILLGDATTHGGRVISGQARYQVNGIPVAFHGCHTSCGAKLISVSGGRQRSGDDMECLT
ncbi:PAAR domain-containing protein [Halomonas mongoliensis]|uniref:PAAR domain-containing protein n=1 Tax=Halomonas mongoliensis TaxID=321265 RepID=A0ABU1GQY3_9GAMM|nr:PAAR domain-containing protein [Halomonas mongoliensis]MDR5894420.1 PAAR domain-containing protein [Halomonas mongoliensis]